MRGAAASVVALALLLAAAGGCSRAARERTELFFAMDTYVEVKLFEANSMLAEEAVAKVRENFTRLEKAYNFYDRASVLSRINAQGSAAGISAELHVLLAEGLRCHRASSGAFDLTVGSLTEIWPFGKESPAPPSAEAVQRALKGVGMERMKLSLDTVALAPGMKLDLGGCLKGYAVKSSIALLRTMGVTRALVNGGGNIEALGCAPDGKPWVVGVQHPRSSSKLMGTVELREGEGIATSGDYQRVFFSNGVRYCHLLDPATGYPASRAMSATVIARDGLAADLLSTAVFVLGPEKGLRLLESQGAEGLVVAEGGTSMTAGMKKRLVVSGT